MNKVLLIYDRYLVLKIADIQDNLIVILIHLKANIVVLYTKFNISHN